MRTEDLGEAIEKFHEQEHLNSYEGRRGVITLARTARALGYKDSQHFGSLGNGAYAGDLLEFFEDNSGAIQAVMEWIQTQRSTEWHESVESQLEMDDEEDEEEEDDEYPEDAYDALLNTDHQQDPLDAPDERDE